MMMKKRDEANGTAQDRSEKEGRPEPSKQARLHALLFSGTAPALMAAVGVLDPKLPRWVGE
jgi:hypothetical protein